YRKNGKFYTNGGRVLGVTALAPVLKEAVNKAYATVSNIHFEKMHYRTDIARKAWEMLT
ncbi:MAG: phosphoribosylamine--glycine ligase, partial [Calditrichaeota bacterium]